MTHVDVRRADFYNGTYGSFVTNFADIGSNNGTPFTTSLDDVLIWTGVTNNVAYKTTKLVLRRIPAKGKSFYMGAAGITNDEVSIARQYSCLASENFRVKVSFTNDFWLGVFEITQKQYAFLKGEDASAILDVDAVKPQSIKYESLRGTPTNWQTWPANVYEVSSSSVLQTMRTKLAGMTVDVPTEAQWEFACRAGTDTQMYSGLRYSAANYFKIYYLPALAWTSDVGSGKSVEVGLLLPNAFGLYDTLGNAAELVRDIFDPANPSSNSSAPVGPAPLAEGATEPMGWTDGDAAALLGADCKSLYRGGSWYRNFSFCNPAGRREWCNLSDRAQGTSGFRLFVYAE